MGGGRRTRAVLAALVAAASLALNACAGSGVDALTGGDIGGSYAAQVVLGRTITYGAAVVHARGHTVTLRSAELVAYQGHYSSIRVRTAVVGPGRGGVIVDSDFGFPGHKLRARAEPVHGARVAPPTGNGPDYGVELLFGLTPAAYGNFRYRSVRVTYEVDGHTYTRELPAPFRMCVVKRIKADQCNSDDLLAGAS